MAAARAVFCDGGADHAPHPGGRRAHTRRTQTGAPDRSILALDEALTAFSKVAPRQAKVVELRYFGGLTEKQIVAALNISPRTVERDWDLAKAWLFRELSHKTEQPPAL